MGHDTSGSEVTITMERRRVLRRGALGAGSAAVGVTALSGSSLAGCTGGHIRKAVFCGCSQVCVCGDGHHEVLVAHETDDGFTCEWAHEASGNFCYETDAGKVIAVKAGKGEEVVYNPHEPCAGDAIEYCKQALDIPWTRPGDSGGPCGEAFLRTCGEESDHPGRGRSKPKGRGWGRGGPGGKRKDRPGRGRGRGRRGP